MNRVFRIRYRTLKEIRFKSPTVPEKTRVPMHYVEIRDLFRRSIEKHHKSAVNCQSSTSYRILQFFLPSFYVGLCFEEHIEGLLKSEKNLTFHEKTCQLSFFATIKLGR